MEERDYGLLAQKLQPYLLPWVRQAAGRGGRGGGGVSAGVQIGAHDLDDTAIHTGTLSWAKINKTGSSLGDLAVRAHALLTGRDADDHSQYMHNSVARTVTARHVFNPPSAASPFVIGANGNAQLVAGLNAQFVGGQLESVFTRKVANANQDMNGFVITSPDSDTTHLLGRGVFGYVGHSDYVGLAHRDQATATDYGFLQGALGDTFVNHPTGRVTYLRSNNTTLVSLDDEFLRFFPDIALKANNYASQTLGWQITHDGQLDARYIFANEMHVRIFTADLEQTLAGLFRVAKSLGRLALAFTAPAAGASTTIRFKDFPEAPNMAIFESGDIIAVYIFTRAAGSLTLAFCWGAVTGYTDQSDGTQVWTFTRSTSPNAGSMSSGTVVSADSVALDFGVSGNGFFEINAIDGAYAVNSPYDQIVVWTGHPATGQQVKIRRGNLKGVGITDYGMVMGTDVGDPATTTFDFRASSGTLRLGPLDTGKPNWYWDATTMRLRINTSTFLFANATEFGLQTGDGVRRIVLKTDGSSYFDGLMTISSTGEVRQGTGALGTDFGGFRIRNVSGMGRISSYDSDDENLLIDNLGLDMLQDDQLIGVKARALSWWPSLASRGGNPTGMITHFQNGASFENTTLIRARGLTSGFFGRVFLEAISQAGASYELVLDSRGTLTTDADVGIGGDLTVNGILGGSWAALTPATGWANAGGGLGTLAIKQFGDLVALKGRCTYSSGGSANVVVNLSAGYRPGETYTVACVTSLGGSIALREVRVRTNGDVGPSGWTPGSGDWVSLDGISYYL